MRCDRSVRKWCTSELSTISMLAQGRDTMTSCSSGGTAAGPRAIREDQGGWRASGPRRVKASARIVRWLAAGTGDVSGDDVGGDDVSGMAVEGDSGPVLAHRGA